MSSAAPRRSAPAILFACVLAHVAAAQCPIGWAEGFAQPWPDGAGSLGVFDDGTGPSLFVGSSVQGVGAYGITRWNGVEWSRMFPSPSYAVSPRSFAVFDDGSGPALYVGFGISSPIGYVGKWNGSTWSTLASGTNGAVWSLVVFDDGTGPALYAGGDFTNGVARWDGTGWSALGSGIGGPTPSVRCLTVWNDGLGPALYAGGLFTSAGGAPALNIARWNGGFWSALGSGIPGPPLPPFLVPVNPAVRDATSYDDGSGAALYVTGSFTSAGGAAANDIARWNGTSWSAVGSGIGGGGNCPATWDDGGGPALFVGGQFVFAGGISAWGIARYRAGSWSACGTGLQSSPFFGFPQVGTAQALRVYDDGTGPALYASGGFTQAGGTPVLSLARWNGMAWSGFDTLGLHGGRVSAFGVADLGDGPALYAGGLFTRFAGGSANKFARLKDARWSVLGTGMTSGGDVLAFASFDDGGGPAVFAAGIFDSVGGVAANGVGKWNGSAWTGLSTGLGPSPVYGGPRGRALAVFDDGTGAALYAGGDFPTAGGIPAPGIAKWNGTAWSPAGGVPGVEVTALIVGDLGAGPTLFAAGRVTGTWTGMVGVDSSGWQAIGWVPGVGYYGGDPVMAFTVFDDGTGPALYVGGAFMSIGGVVTNSVAKWNGTWSAVANLGVGRVDSLAAYDDGGGMALYAYGAIDVGGGTFANLVRISGGSWAPVGGDVWPLGGTGALQVFDDGGGTALYVGGDFGRAGARNSSKIAKWGPLRPRVILGQPGGPGGGITVRDVWLQKSHEYYNIGSVTPCPGSPGGGPFLGLCASDPSVLVAQFALPSGVLPFHFVSQFDAMTFGPYGGLLSGVTLEAVCFDITGGVLGCVSSVSRITIQ